MAQLQRKEQEKLRGKIMEMVKRELKTLRAASLEFGISYSQAKRIYQHYLTGGDEALVYGNKGRPSNNKTGEGIVKKAAELYRENYFDGSHHDWFEGRGRPCCLMTRNDNATKIRLSLFFEEETMFGAMTLLKGG
jgi:hypothetical protein